MQFTLRRMAVAVVVAVLATAMFLYAYIQRIFTKAPSQKIVLGYQCSPEGGAQQAQKNNPNKALFISCGGLLE